MGCAMRSWPLLLLISQTCLLENFNRSATSWTVKISSGAGKDVATAVAALTATHVLAPSVTGCSTDSSHLVGHKFILSHLIGVVKINRCESCVYITL
jgi:hypothetical protein